MERGWPQDREKIPEHCVTFYEKRESLSFEEGILLWGGRIVVPEVFRKWSRIHVDYAGPFEGKYWLVVIDAYSKWLGMSFNHSICNNQTSTGNVLPFGGS